MSSTENELTIITNQSINNHFTFKSAKLNSYSKQIADKVNDMSRNGRDIAVILGNVLSDKAYEEDGFQSVGEYAEKTFGLKSSQAYRLARTAVQFLIPADKGEFTPEVTRAINNTPITNLSELNSVGKEKAVELIADGKVTPYSTQQAIRKLVSADKPARAVKMINIYDHKGTLITVHPKDDVNDFLKASMNGDNPDKVKLISCDDVEDNNTLYDVVIAVDTSRYTTRAYRLLEVKPDKKVTRKPRANTAVNPQPILDYINTYKQSHNGAEPSATEIIAFVQSHK